MSEIKTAETEIKKLIEPYIELHRNADNLAGLLAQEIAENLFQFKQVTSDKGAEEILERYSIKFNDGEFHGTTLSNVLNAMEEYAKQFKQPQTAQLICTCEDCRNKRTKEE
jgi:hypothetical protein